MKKLLFIVLFLAAVNAGAGVCKIGPIPDTVTNGRQLGDTYTIVQEYICQYDCILDSGQIRVQTGRANDTTYIVVYSKSGDNPGTLIAKTTEYHEGAGTGFINLQFDGTDTLIEGMRYFIGIEHINGNTANNSQFRVHKHRSRYSHSVRSDSLALATWVASTDAWETDGLIPYAALFGTPVYDGTNNAYDTAIYTVVDTLTKGAELWGKGLTPFAQNQHSTETVMRFAFWDTQGDTIGRPILGSDNDTAINRHLQISADEIISCTLRVQLVQLAAQGNRYMQFISNSWVEGDVGWKDRMSGTVWTAAGGDVYSMVLDTFVLADTNVSGQWLLGADTNTNNTTTGLLKACDSLLDSSWTWAGIRLKLATEAGTGNNSTSTIGSDDTTGAARPIIWFTYLEIYQTDTTTPSTLTRHGGGRHGARLH